MSMEYSLQIVQHASLKALETGMKDESLTINFRPIIRTRNISNDVLMRYVKDAPSIQGQRKSKFSNQAQIHAVCNEASAATQKLDLPKKRVTKVS